MHHAMIDGQGTMALLNSMLDTEPNPRRKKKVMAASIPSPMEFLPSNMSMSLKAIRRLLSRPGQIARFAVGTAPALIRSQLRGTKPSVVAKGVPKTPFNDTITPGRVFDARFYDLEGVKQMRQLVPGSTVNDVVLAIISGALRLYLSSKQALPEDTLVVSVPISLRTKETANNASGNELVPYNVPLCTHIVDPVERLQAICEVMTSTKSYVNAIGAKTMQQVNTALPGALIGTIARASFEIGRMRGRPAVANTVVTNVPGMQTPLYLCGAEVLRLTGGAPPIGTIGLVNSVGCRSSSRCRFRHPRRVSTSTRTNCPAACASASSSPSAC
jgi:WS/DGAT/MGAT family acyltransferase